METTTTTTIQVETEVLIAGEKFRAIKATDKHVFFAKVLRSGKLAKPGKGTMGTYSLVELAKWISVGGIEIVQ